MINVKKDEKSKILNVIKNNIFFIIVLISYVVMFIVKPPMGVTSVKNSVYYLKEMLMIMPVIFVLTALLDTWVPKKTIMKSLGKESKIKGTIFAFILGGISAGPIYAAFPFCVMLHKKGASVKNIIIILSSWAVIKVPMLINEVKFLGVKFMAIRWALTMVAIIIFSWIASKIIKDKDLPEEKEEENKCDVSINRDACMGCSLCAKNYPELFGINNKKAEVKEHDFIINVELLNKVVEQCPVSAITTNIVKQKGEDIINEISQDETDTVEEKESEVS
ncbi:MAG: permease [Clostridia bacterium]